MQEVYEQIGTYVDQHRDEMIALWQELVNTESGTYQVAGVNRMGEILCRELEKSGFTARQIPMEKTGNMLVAEWNPGSAKAPFLFIGHLDTVFKEGAAQQNPFRIDEAGRAYGPGVLDMKGGLVIALYAAKALAQAGYNCRPIKFILAGDEENLHKDSPTGQLMAEEAKGAAACFNFETGYEDDGVVVGRKGGGILHIHVQGVAVHSGIAPQDGRSAVLEAAHKIVEIESQNDYARGLLMNCGVVQGGIGENTVPGSCLIKVGIRFPTMAIKQEIMEIVEQAVANQHVPDTTATLEVAMGMDCMETTAGVEALFAHLKQVAKDCGYGEIHSFTTGGISDSAITVVAGVPTVCAVGVRGQGNHTEAEYAIVETLFERCKLAACAVYAYQ